MYTLITIIHIFVSLLLIGIVLFQADEGSGLGGAFGTSMAGSGGGSMFGKKGAAGVLTNFTRGLAAIFIVTSFLLTYMISNGLVNLDDMSSASRSQVTLNVA